MHLLLSVDGLSIRDWVSFQRWLPNSAEFLSQHKPVPIKSTFASAHASWAELLTGQPWYKNGCYGYARLAGSIDSLDLYDETALKEPITLVDNEAPVINAPLIHPKTRRGAWLSDGSLPINKLVHPSNLKNLEPFSYYEARLYPSIARAEQSNTYLGNQWIDLETNRLNCAKELLSSNQSTAIYRITLFDQLAQIFGTGFLETRNLRISAKLEQFFILLDSWLARILSASNTKISVFSMYSHQPCIGVLNLNWILSQGNYLKVAAHKAKMQSAIIFEKLGTELKSFQTTSLEHHVDVAATTACSSVSETICLNRISSFQNGTVADASYPEVRRELKQFLLATLERLFGKNFEFTENPLELPICSTPEFVVHLPGIALHNMQTTNLKLKPNTVHSPTGFVSSCDQELLLKTRITPSELNFYLRGEEVD